MSSEPLIEQVDGVWSHVSGILYRAVDPAYRHAALLGSRLAGRYSDADQPTLYLSSTPQGVEAALKAHAPDRNDQLDLLKFHVDAHKIIDLRNPAVLLAVGVDLADAVAPWQDIVKSEGRPTSWNVRRHLEALGANGLIDPSRTRPGLWHLVLFRWNSQNAPHVSDVQILSDPTATLP